MDMTRNSALSYQSGEGSYSYIYATIPDLLDQKAAAQPDAIANVFRLCTPDANGNIAAEIARDAVTFKQLADGSLKVASYLVGLGLQPGDVVAILASPCTEWLYLDYACLRLKVLLLRIPVIIMTEEALKTTMNKYQVKLLVVGAGDIATRTNIIFPGLMTGRIEVSDVQVCFLQKDIASSVVPDIGSIAKSENPVDYASIKAIQESIDPDDVAILLSTSGTTGLPKYIQHSHFSYINGTNCYMRLFQLDESRDSFYADRPYQWIGSFPLIPVIVGIPLIRLDSTNKISPTIKAIFQVIEEEKATLALCMAFLLYDAMLLHNQNELEIPKSLVGVATGGEKIPEKLLEFAQATFRETVTAYGSTETFVNMPAILSKTPDINTGSLSHYRVRSPLECKIVDDSGRVTPRNQVGIIHIRSSLNMRGYFQDSRSTAEVLHESGWLNTKDIGIMLSDGSVQVIGRTTDVISRGGTKIYPQVLEKVILGIPKVGNALVVGVPDARLFNEICACVTSSVPKGVTEEEIRCGIEQQLCERSILVPKYIVIIEDIPRNRTGKIDRKAATEIARKYLGL